MNRPGGGVARPACPWVWDVGRRRSRAGSPCHGGISLCPVQLVGCAHVVGGIMIRVVLRAASLRPQSCAASPLLRPHRDFKSPPRALRSASRTRPSPPMVLGGQFLALQHPMKSPRRPPKAFSNLPRSFRNPPNKFPGRPHWLNEGQTTIISPPMPIHGAPLIFNSKMKDRFATPLMILGHRVCCYVRELLKIEQKATRRTKKTNCERMQCFW